MDKLQKWLKEKEAKSPSPSLQKEPASLRDKLKTLRRSIGRSVKYVQPVSHNTLSEYQRKEQERVRQYYEEGSYQKNTHEDNWFKNARKRIVETIRHPEITWCYGRRDNLDSALDTMKYLWKTAGWEDWQLPREDLMKIRKRAIAPQIKTAVQELYATLGREGIVQGDLLNPLSHIKFLASSADMKFNSDGLWAKLMNELPKIAPFVPLHDALSYHPQYHVVHGVPEDYKKGSLENNLIIDRSKKPTWKDFIGFVMDEKPTLACSSLTSQDAPSAMYSVIGVIIKDGKVQNASTADSASITYSTKVKLPQSIRGPEGLKERISCAITQRSGRYNELIVAEPEIKGLYFSDGVTNLGGGMSLCDSFLDSEEKTSQAVRELAQISLQRSLPLYFFTQGKGFQEVNPRDYIAKAGTEVQTGA